MSVSPPLVCRRLRVADATRSRYRSVFCCSFSVTGKLQIAASPRIWRAAASYAAAACIAMPHLSLLPAVDILWGNFRRHNCLQQGRHIRAEGQPCPAPPGSTPCYVPCVMNSEVQCTARCPTHIMATATCATTALSSWTHRQTVDGGFLIYRGCSPEGCLLGGLGGYGRGQRKGGGGIRVHVISPRVQGNS